jgi:CBS domain-containing protein
MTEERPVKDETDRPEADILTKKTRISEARSVAGEEPCVVPRDMDLRDVARQMWQRRWVRMAAVVDAEGRLVGILSLRLLLDELFFHVAPEELMSDVLERGRIEEIGRLVRAERAEDLMQPAVYVTLDDTVKDAFGRMHDHKVGGLPIVDEEMRPVGYLDRFQLLEVWIREHPRESRGSP